MSSLWCLQILPWDCIHDFLECVGLEGRTPCPTAAETRLLRESLWISQPLLENCLCLKSVKEKNILLFKWNFLYCHLTLWALILKLHTLKNSLAPLFFPPCQEVAAGPLLCLEVTEFWVYKLLCTFHCSLNNHNKIFWKAIKGTWEMSSGTITPLNTGLITCTEGILLSSVHYTKCQLEINVKRKKKQNQ